MSPERVILLALRTLVLTNVDAFEAKHFFAVYAESRLLGLLLTHHALLLCLLTATLVSRLSVVFTIVDDQLIITPA